MRAEVGGARACARTEWLISSALNRMRNGGPSFQPFSSISALVSGRGHQPAPAPLVYHGPAQHGEHRSLGPLVDLNVISPVAVD